MACFLVYNTTFNCDIRHFMGEKTPLRLLLYFDQGYSVFGCGHCHVMHGNCSFSRHYTAGASRLPWKFSWLHPDYSSCKTSWMGVQWNTALHSCACLALSCSDYGRHHNQQHVLALACFVTQSSAEHTVITVMQSSCCDITSRCQTAVLMSQE